METEHQALRVPSRVVDAHQHFWNLDKGRYMLLSDPPMPRRFGDYRAIRKDYLPVDYLKDTAGIEVEATIHVEAGYAGPPVEETRWLAELHDQSGLPTAALVSVDFAAGNVAEQIFAHRAMAGGVQIVGIRQHAHWSEDRQYTGTKRPDILSDPEWRKAVHIAAREGLTIEIPIFFNQSEDLATLIEGVPEAKFVLGHAALPVHFDPPPVPFKNAMGSWQRSIELLAQYPNVSTKLSGLWMCGRHLSPEEVESTSNHVIKNFGINRTMFGSNFPIDKLQIGFAEMTNLFAKALAPFGYEAVDKFFRKNAWEIYSLQPK